MDRSTVVRIAIPLSLYESVKGKILNEEEVDYSKYEWLTDNLQEALYEFIAEGEYRQGDEEELKSDVESVISRLVDRYIKGKLKPRDINEAKKTVDPAKKKAEMAEKKKMEAKKAEAEKKKAEVKKAAEKKAADIKKKKEADAKKVEAEKKKAAEAKKKAKA